MVSRVSNRKAIPAPSPSRLATSDRWFEKGWVPPVLLAVILLAIFFPVCASEFVAWDDNLNVSKNPSFNPPSFSTVIDYWKGPYLDLYIPVTYTAWGILAAVAQMPVPDSSGVRLNPYVFHTANLILHLLTTLIVYALLARLMRARWPAMAGALLFGLHPLQVEPVAWVTGLKDVMSGTLTIAALWQYVCYADERTADQPSGGRYRHYVFSILLLALAVLAKPSAVILPVLAVGVDLLILRSSLKSSLISTAPLFLLAIGGIIEAKVFQTPVRPADAGYASMRPLIALDSFAFYIAKLLCPWKLGIHYDHSPLVIIRSGWVYFTWIIPVAIAIAALALRRRSTWLIPAVVLFVVPLLPVSGLVPFSFQRYSTVADRYAYVAILGPALALAALVLHRGVKSWQVALAVALAVGCAARSFAQTWIWHDNSSLFHSALETNPRSFLAYNHLAGQLIIEHHADDTPEEILNRMNRVREYSRQAIELAPDSPDGYLTLGMICEITNDLDGAVAAFRKAVQLAPDKADSLHALGGALAAEGHFEEAEPLLRRSIQVNPRFAQGHLNLGLLLLQKFGSHNEEAFRETELAVRLDGSDPRAHVNYATLLAARGQREQAMEHVKIALQIEPTLREAIILDRRLRGLGR